MKKFLKLRQQTYKNGIPGKQLIEVNMTNKMIKKYRGCERSDILNRIQTFKKREDQYIDLG